MANDHFHHNIMPKFNSFSISKLTHLPHKKSRAISHGLCHFELTGFIKTYLLYLTGQTPRLGFQLLFLGCGEKNVIQDQSVPC